MLSAQADTNLDLSDRIVQREQRKEYQEEQKQQANSNPTSKTRTTSGAEVEWAVKVSKLQQDQAPV